MWSALADGTYTITETVTAGWDLTGISCPATTSTITYTTTGVSIALAGSENITCTFTNTKRGHLVVQKTTNPALDSTVFTVSATGTGTIIGGGAGTITDALDKNYEVTPGTYSVAETVPAGWTKTGDTCQGVVVAAGATSTCLFINIKDAKVVVHKIVINHGLSYDASHFADYKVGTTTVTLDATTTMNSGSYVVSENADSTNYTQIFSSGDCDANGNITLIPGQTKSCTITNEEIPSYLVVHKIVINHGGNATTATFADYKIDSTIVALDATTTVDSGSHTVSEATSTDYTQTFPGDCNGNGVVTVPTGTTKSCTITNEEKPAQLIVIKVVVNDNGGTKVVSNFPLFVDTTMDVTSSSTNTFNSGAHVVSETRDSGYAATISGDCDANGNVTLTAGNTKTCTITNDDITPHLIVIKHVINDDGDVATSSDFIMYLTGNNPSNNNFAGSESGVNVTLNAGAYTADEVSSAGYIKTLSADCTGTIALGETKTCTITNNDTPHATRTLGFWQTHTIYTTTVFGTTTSWIIGTHNASTTPSLFAGFYASISKKSDGSKRLAIDQARMQMLQQWLAAKLNCQAFTCSAATQTLLATAATAWAGTNTSLILSYASQLDTYNNSNDALPITGQGSATPKVSQSTASTSLSFWNVLP